MTTQRLFARPLRLPVIGAPMFLVSGIELVLAQCKAGIVGSFPSLNARSPQQLAQWLERIARELAAHDAAFPERLSAPFGVNLILHRSNLRQAQDLDTLTTYQVPLVITSVGKPDHVVQRVHAYGGKVLHDVISSEHARKAIACGVDGLILVCAGAGGHAGTLSPFAFVREVRRFWDGPIALAGGLSDGASIRAAEVMGADFAYLGTRFIATVEASAEADYKAMLVHDSSADIIYTPALSGIHANYLINSIRACGIDPARLDTVPGPGGSEDLFSGLEHAPKAWKHIWSAGHGVGAITDVPGVAELVQRLLDEYRAAGGIACNKATGQKTTGQKTTDQEAA